MKTSKQRVRARLARINESEYLGMTHDCQCHDASIDHEPNQCPYTARYFVERDGEKIWVCGNCILSSDKKLHTADDNED